MIDSTHPSLAAATASGRVVIPEVLAAIDIGTNSIHMIVARALSDGRFEVVTRLKEMVRLGETGDDHLKELTPAAIERGVAALARCRVVLDTYGAPYAAVATSAVREADNRREFIKRARREAGIDVEVVAGHEEARLIHLGVLQALPVYDRALLLCDIGGGSTELLLGLRGEVRASRSFKLGAIRMTQRFFADGTVTKKSVKQAREFVRSTIAPFGREVRRYGFEIAVASSGTIESLTSMALAAAGQEFQSLNGAVLTREALGDVIASLLEASTPEERALIPGIDRSRSDIIVGGAIILEQVMGQFGIESVTVSDYALREGALFDLASRFSDASLDHLSDIRRRSIAHLMEVGDEDPEHSVAVSRLALSMFAQLEGLHGFGHEEREVLEAASLLANVGMMVAHSKHHQHSYYIIRNSEHLSGFTDPEIELIAQVARYHRRSAPSLKHEAFAALSDEEQAVVRWLSAILRVAIGLDRAHTGAVASVEVSVERHDLVLSLTPSNDSDLALERYAAIERSALLAEVAGRTVSVTTPPVLR